jgi:hypothetical protein
LIQPPHDYRPFRPELALVPEGNLDHRRLEGIFRDICNRRIANAHVLPVDVDEQWLSIETYLGRYDVDDELDVLAKNGLSGDTLRTLREAIMANAENLSEVDELFKVLGTDAPPQNARLHLCLLNRSPQYRPTPGELAKEFLAWMEDRAGGSKRYYDWWHNTKVGLAFLLAHEQRKQKRYAGFDTYCMLSSGIIRYFIELCEQAFDFAHAEGFSWSSPRNLSFQEQTKAAKYVSRYKIKDIERYDPHGPELRQLTMSLGLIFESLHKARNTGLGEPEVNHFSTSAADLASDPNMRGLLDSAVLWAVLQERTPTKDKELSLKVDAVDYHLNHIYCPYFEISYRQKRKIDLSTAELNALSSTGGGSIDLEETIQARTSPRAKQVIKQVLARLRTTPVREDLDTDQAQLKLV